MCELYNLFLKFCNTYPSEVADLRSVKFIHVTLKLMIMGNLLYVVAVILIIGWLVGVVGYGTGGIIHILLVIAIVAILLNVISGRRVL